MESRVFLLVFVSVFAENFVASAQKPAEVIVTEENQQDFEVPIGTKLVLDERTQLYKPPPLSNSFSAWDRYEIMWKNPITYNNYCKQGPSLHRSVSKLVWYSYFYYSWCMKGDVDLCCDNKRCTCGGPKGSNCSCLTDETSEWYKRKYPRDKRLAKGVLKFSFKLLQKAVEAFNSKEAEAKYLEELKESLPKPWGAVTDFGLPQWRRLPLEAKIPRVPGLQQNVYALSRSKLGENLRVDFYDPRRFDTSDPYNFEMKMEYEGMHDRHLTRFFRESPHLRETMIKAGLITEDLNVKCTLKEYNDYRNYLRTMQGKIVRKELDRRDDIHKEKLYLDLAENVTARKNEKLRHDEIKAQALKELRQKYEAKLQSLAIKHKLTDERLNAFKQTKRQIVQRKKLESKIKRELFKQKRAYMAKMEHQKVLQTLKEWAEREFRLEKTKEQNLQKKENAKLEASLNKFELKKRLQEEAIEKETLLRECDENLKRAFLECYNAKINERRKRLQELFIEKREALERELKSRKKAKSEGPACLCKVSKTRQKSTA